MGAAPEEQAIDRFGLAGSVLAKKYRVDRVVAEGGFAVVYRGKHLALDAPVAIKVLKTPPDLSESARLEFVDKFLLEAKTIARMRHPHIVQVLDTGVSPTPSGEHAPWAVLEWLTGDTLEDLISARSGAPLSTADAFALVRPVLEALAHAHDERIAHRDVKPGNIMLVANKRGVSVRLLDFGIAKLMDEGEHVGSGATQTMSARIAYSPAYAAPEQVALSRTGPWTDVHAVALILTELLTGKAPYPSGDATEIASAVLSPDRPTPLKQNVDVGAWQPVLAKALALKPGDRYRDAGELLSALEATLPPGPPPDLVRVLASLPNFRARLSTADTITSPEDRLSAPHSALYPPPSSNAYNLNAHTPPTRPIPTALAVTGDAHVVTATRARAPTWAVIAGGFVMTAAIALAAIPLLARRASTPSSFATSIHASRGVAPNLTQSGGGAPSAQPSHGGAVSADPTAERRSPAPPPPAPAPTLDPAPTHVAAPIASSKKPPPAATVNVTKKPHDYQLE